MILTDVGSSDSLRMWVARPIIRQEVEKVKQSRGKTSCKKQCLDQSSSWWLHKRKTNFKKELLEDTGRCELREQPGVENKQAEQASRTHSQGTARTTAEKAAFFFFPTICPVN